MRWFNDKMEVGFWRNTVLYHNAHSISTFPKTTNFSRCNPRVTRMQQGNRDADYWQWTWIDTALGWWERERDMHPLTVHPDCAADNAVLLYLTHHTARDYVARAPDRGDLASSRRGDKMRHDGRPRLYLSRPCQPVSLRRKFCTGLPGMSVNWGTRAPMIARGLPRRPAERSAGGWRDYITALCTGMLPRVFSQSQRFRTRDSRQRWPCNFLVCRIHSVLMSQNVINHISTQKISNKN